MNEQESDALPQKLENALALLQAHSPEPRPEFLTEVDSIPERFPLYSGQRWRLLAYAAAAAIPLLLGYAASSGSAFDADENEAIGDLDRLPPGEFTTTHLDELEAWTLSEEGTMP